MIVSALKGVAHFTPERVVHNDDLAKVMDTSDQWITERTGIRERRFVAEGTPTSTIARSAILKLFETHQIDPHSIDMILAATLSPDFYFPGLGTLLQHQLSLPHIPALDIRAQCAGFVYGIATADAYLRSGLAKSILLVCAEVQSPVLDMTTRGRDMAVLFGDGAGALLLTADDAPEMPSAKNTVRGVIDSHLGSDGSGAELLYLKAPGTATPGFINQSDIDERLTAPKMDGRQVFKNAVHRMIETAEILLTRNGLSPEDISLVLPHQANLRINEAVREKLGLKSEQGSCGSDRGYLLGPGQVYFIPESVKSYSVTMVNGDLFRVSIPRHATIE